MALLKKSLQIAVIALCVLVFAWGLHYKLSLYQATASSAPAAKLLDGKSDIAAQDSASLARPRLRPVLGVSVMGMLILFANGQKLLSCRLSRDERAQLSRVFALRGPSRLASRPPPPATV